MNTLVKLCKRIEMALFNKRNDTSIHSLFANLEADYGKKVRIDEGTRVASDVSIGAHSYVNENSSLENCEIGKFCSISSGVYLSPYNHNLKGITTHPIGDYKRERQKVVVGNDVLISLNAVIMEGVHIGNGAVIGAGAVVTHDVGDYEIWGGVPAKFIGYRVEDGEKRRALSGLKWWDEGSESQHLLIQKYMKSLDGIENEIKEKGTL